MKLICSTDNTQRKDRLKSAVRYPAKSIFNLTESKANLVQNSSLPRNSTHIYALSKGLYSSQTNIANELTRTQSMPNNQGVTIKTKSFNSGAPLSISFTADQKRFMMKNSQPDFIMLDHH